MMRRVLFAAILFCCVTNTMANELLQRELSLTVGESRVLTMTSGADITVVDSTLINVVAITSNRLLVRALKPGTTAFFSAAPNHALTRWQVTINAAVAPQLTQQINALRQSEQHLAVKNQGELLVLTGQVSAAAMAVIESLEKRYPTLLNKASVLAPERQMIELNVQIIEVKRQQIDALGVQWQRIINGPLIAFGGQSSAGWQGQIDSQIQLMQERGVAKILANPVLTTQSGEKAGFLAGGEVPIPQIAEDGRTDVSYKPYGISLEIKPQLTPQGQIVSTINAEVSNLDPAVSVAGVPGLLTRKSQAVVTSESGERVMLSGLLSDDHGDTDERVPGLADIPAVGAAFTMRQQRRQQTELLVMVTAITVKDRQQQQQRLTTLTAERSQWQNDATCTGMEE
ncbi:hypothetical protein CWI84_05430 [Idiomarina tyrosinivorans]|uniref:Uncharacterized protein n=1 Tax=Idiomarina tyrosinivorans TaxID=1445662 RepID=A0A432ZRH7_9GAMM|nr:pilus assembly protein N-terminal domain-containing protein [Idiomarina tyrosinivorans]RUO80499.1 hypothetical protein CWI84_05430 [Idiomarina tyrosinivorans]